LRAHLDSETVVRGNDSFSFFFVAILPPQHPPQRWHETTRYGFYFMPGVGCSALEMIITM
jgi:hypothetical protein